MISPPTGSQRLEILLRNARQLARIARTTFPAFSIDGSKNCVSPSKDVTSSLGCSWSLAVEAVNAYTLSNDRMDLVAAENRLLCFCRQAQLTMSNAASDYKVTNLYVASGLAIVATVLAYIASLSILRVSTMATCVLFFVIVCFSATMAASSFVEEEQQFWYWIAVGWMFYLHAKLYVFSLAALPPCLIIDVLITIFYLKPQK